MRLRPTTAIALLFPTATALARPGDLAEPIAIPSMPFVHASTTLGRAMAIAHYACAPTTSEAGPEVVYTFTTTRAGTLSATLYGDLSPVDIDIQLLSALALDGTGTATSCLDRGNTEASVEVGPGTYYLVVDTFQSATKAGDYRLRADFQPNDEWYRRPIARGVTLATQRYASLFSSVQFGSVLEIDLSDPMVNLKPITQNGCTTVSALATTAGAVAAVNGGFFDPPMSCAPVSLLKIDGHLVASNVVSRTSFGIDAQRAASMQVVAVGQDWPGVTQAVGGGPRLVTAGAIDVHATDEIFDAAFIGRNPRTALGIGAAGRLVLATVDGRTSAGAGMSLAELAQWMIWLDTVSAMNLDGGGSTTMWAAGEPYNGVVNHPSLGPGDHSMESEVSHAIGVFAPALDRPPLWLTDPPPGPVRVGQSWTWEVVAADPEGLPVRFRVSGPMVQGALRFDDRNDGTAALSFTPTAADALASAVHFSLFAEVMNAAGAEKALTLEVIDPNAPDGGVAPTDGGGANDTGAQGPIDAAPTIEATLGDQGGCSCNSAGSSLPPGALLLLLAALLLLRRSKPLVAILLLILLPATSHAGGGPENVLVLYNADLPDAARVALHYAELRALPEGHLCPIHGVDPAHLDAIDFPAYQQLIRPAFDACLAATPEPEEIDYLLLVRGLPYRAGPVSLESLLEIEHAARNSDHVEIAGTPLATSASIENPAFVGFGFLGSDFVLMNPYQSWYSSASAIIHADQLPRSFRRRDAADASGVRFAGHLFIVTQLDGFDFDDAKAVADRGAASDGTFPSAEILAMHGADDARGARDPEDELATRMLARAGLPGVFVPAFDGQLAGHTVAAYFTGAADLRGAIAGNTFVPGAITDNLTSFGAVPENFVCDMSGAMCPASESQTSAARFIRAGATGAHGTVNEPLNNVFPNAGALLFYTFGYNLAESYFLNRRFLYWHNFTIGDPLASPYARRPAVRIDGAGSARAVGSMLVATATHSDGIAAMRIYDRGRRVAEAVGDRIALALTGTVGSVHDLLVVAIAANATVARPGWPAPSAHPRADVQGWRRERFALVAEPPPDAGLIADSGAGDAMLDRADAGGAPPSEDAGASSSEAKGCGCMAASGGSAPAAVLLLAALALTRGRSASPRRRTGTRWRG